MNKNKVLITFSMIFVLYLGEGNTQTRSPEVEVDLLLIKAMNAIDQDDFAAASKHFKEIENIDIVKPNDFWYHYGYALFKSQNFGRAIRKLNRYVSLAGPGSSFYVAALEKIVEAEIKNEKLVRDFQTRHATIFDYGKELMRKYRLEQGISSTEFPNQPEFAWVTTLEGEAISYWADFGIPTTRSAPTMHIEKSWVSVGMTFENSWDPSYPMYSKREDGMHYVGLIDARGQWTGLGKLVYQHGNVYIGNFENGRRAGKGRYQVLNGNNYEGNWVDGNLQGLTLVTSKSGSTCAIVFENGEVVRNTGQGQSVHQDFPQRCFVEYPDVISYWSGDIRMDDRITLYPFLSEQ